MNDVSELKIIPGPPPGLPILGNLREIQQKEILQFGADIRANYDDITITLKKRGEKINRSGWIDGIFGWQQTPK